MERLSFELSDAAATTAAGAALAAALLQRAGAVIFLEGPLGAGKTTFARGFLRALGVSGTVRSPTYTLMEPYAAGARTVLHMDLYRLRDPAELWELGLDSYPPEQSIWLVEWPERGAGLLPAPAVRIRLEHRETSRVLTAEAAAEVLRDFRRNLQSAH
ncbi:MAG: tRNA (adenosine(37)-N6)-threonylcarbamoyltransferase complex ATPase subunit type 1 TsaE [Gammaproteobacteria bacterium]